MLEINKLIATFPEIEEILYGDPDLGGRETAHARATSVGTALLDFFENLLIQNKFVPFPPDVRAA